MPTELLERVAELVATLRARYTAPEVPPCRVCGGKLSLQAVGGGRPTVWACDGYDTRMVSEEEFERDWHPGRSFVDKHYSDSRYEQYQHGDSLVLELCDLAEELTA